MSIIQELKDEGVLKLYHDYRTGRLDDLSGNGNDGTSTSTSWTKKGLDFSPTASRVDVADSAELQVTEGTIVILTPPITIQRPNQYVLIKRDGGGTNYQFYLNTSQMVLYDGAGSSTLAAVSVLGSRCVAVSFASGETASFYSDGILKGSGVGTVAITTDDAPVKIGNSVGNNLPFGQPISAALIFSRKLTALEHAKLFSELENTVFPTKPHAKALPGISTIYFKTDYGVNVSTANVTSGLLENSGIENLTGTHKIEMDTHNGQDVKVINAVVGGTLKIPGEILSDTGWSIYRDSGSGYVEVTSGLVASNVLTTTTGHKYILSNMAGNYSINKT